MKNFVIKAKRSRYLIDKNKTELLEKLCHNWYDVLDSKYFVADGSPKYIQLAKAVVGKPAYCISFNEEYDGKTLVDASPFKIDGGFPVLLTYNDDLSWFKTESCPKANAYFLSK